MQQGGLPGSARPDDGDPLGSADLQRRNRKPEIGLREMKGEIANGDHSFLKTTALLTWLCRTTFKAVIFHEAPAASTFKSAEYSLIRVWMWPQCSTVPWTCQITRSTKPRSLWPASSVFKTLTSCTRATAPPCSCMMRPCLIFRYKSASKSPCTLRASASYMSDSV